MIDCGREVVVLDVLRDLGVEDLNCGTKGARIFQDTLDRFFLDVMDLPFARVTEVVAGTGQQTITTDFPIYDFVGFFGTGACSSCLLTKEDCSGCSTCSMCDDGACLDTLKLKQVISTRSDEEDTTYREGEYSVCYKTIKINVPAELEDGYAVYIRGADELTDLATDTINYPVDVMIALKLLIQYDYAIREHDFEVANFFGAKYTDAIAKLKNKDTKVPYAVGMSVKMV